jgi:hypothetical protein
VFGVKRARTSAAAPLSIVSPADGTVPPERRYVFVNDGESSFAQHAADFIQHESWILRVVQHITQQHCVKALVLDRKMAPVVRQVIDARGSAVSDVQANHCRAEHALQVMCDETVAATDVEYIGSGRQHTRDFERHIVSTSDFASSPHTPEAAFDRCG